MGRPNLSERLTMLASLPDECLNRIRDFGLKVEIDAKGTITMQSRNEALSEADRARQDDLKMRDAY